MKFLVFIFLPLFVGLGFVDLTEEGSKVREATADEANNCKILAWRPPAQKESSSMENKAMNLWGSQNESATLARTTVTGEIGKDGKMKWLIFLRLTLVKIALKSVFLSI